MLCVHIRSPEYMLMYHYHCIYLNISVTSSFIPKLINFFRLYIESEEKLILLHLEKELLVKMEQ